MALYYYQKKEKPNSWEIWQWRFKSWWRNPMVKRGSSAFILGLGSFLIGTALYPMVSYQIKYAPKFTPIYSPVPEESGWRLPLLVSAKDNKDYTLISSWFAEKPELEKKNENQVEYYTLDIPALKIKGAIVHVGGKDLKKELVQYSDTALPGSFGNTVIFGHSTTFFNPDNYLAIFTDLYKLKSGPNGDRIIIYYDGVRYVYRVEEIFEVIPTDLGVLAQSYERKRVRLITCTPPGTYLRRLVVDAHLVDE